MTKFWNSYGESRKQKGAGNGASMKQMQRKGQDCTKDLIDLTVSTGHKHDGRWQ